MGSGIAEICARAGLDVLVTEVNAEALDSRLMWTSGSVTRPRRGTRWSR
ncbi:3-hydroxyacyl-CoA dehydrogenase NAD-binding domain-containing protein, partial [Amycolatopsis acidiphila]